MSGTILVADMQHANEAGMKLYNTNGVSSMYQKLTLDCIEAKNQKPYSTVVRIFREQYRIGISLDIKQI